MHDVKDPDGGQWTVDGGITSAMTSMSGVAGCKLGPIHKSGLTPPSLGSSNRRRWYRWLLIA